MRTKASAKIFLIIAVLLLVAKPFLGFALFSRLHQPSSTSIFIKAFAKRKLEYANGSGYDMATVQKKLATPVEGFLLFAFFLAIIAPFAVRHAHGVGKGYLRQLKLQSTPNRHPWLLYNTLLI